MKNHIHVWTTKRQRVHTKLSKHDYVANISGVNLHWLADSVCVTSDGSCRTEQIILFDHSIYTKDNPVSY